MNQERESFLDSMNLSDNARYIVSMVDDYPGSYNKQDLIRELRLAADIGLREANEAYDEARAKFLIQGRCQSWVSNELSEAGDILPSSPKSASFSLGEEQTEVYENLKRGLEEAVRKHPISKSVARECRYPLPEDMTRFHPAVAKLIAENDPAQRTFYTGVDPETGTPYIAVLEELSKNTVRRKK